MLRPVAMLEASLLSSPSTVSVGPVYGTSDEPSAVGTTGFGIGRFSVSKSALRMVTQAPATVAWPAV